MPLEQHELPDIACGIQADAVRDEVLPEVLLSRCVSTAAQASKPSVAAVHVKALARIRVAPILLHGEGYDVRPLVQIHGTEM